MQRTVHACCAAFALAAASSASGQPIVVSPAPAVPSTPQRPQPVAPATIDGDSWDVFWPIRGGCRADDRHDAAAFFSLGYTKVLSNFDMTVWRDQGSLHTELASDTGFCFFRLGLGVTMAKASGNPTDAVPADQKEAVQRLVTSGGNVVLGGAAPLLFYLFDTKDRQSWIGAFLSPRVGTDVPLLSEGSHFSGNADLGVEAHGVYSTDQKKFSFYARARGSWLWATRNYADQIGIASRDAWLAQGLVGVRVTDVFQVSVTFLLYAPKAIRDRYPDALVTLTANAPGAAAGGSIAAKEGDK